MEVFAELDTACRSYRSFLQRCWIISVSSVTFWLTLVISASQVFQVISISIRSRRKINVRFLKSLTIWMVLIWFIFSLLRFSNVEIFAIFQDSLCFLALIVNSEMQNEDSWITLLLSILSLTYSCFLALNNFNFSWPVLGRVSSMTFLVLLFSIYYVIKKRHRRLSPSLIFWYYRVSEANIISLVTSLWTFLIPFVRMKNESFENSLQKMFIVSRSKSTDSKSTRHFLFFSAFPWIIVVFLIGASRGIVRTLYNVDIKTLLDSGFMRTQFFDDCLRLSFYAMYNQSIVSLINLTTSHLGALVTVHVFASVVFATLSSSLSKSVDIVVAFAMTDMNTLFGVGYTLVTTVLESVSIGGAIYYLSSFAFEAVPIVVGCVILSIILEIRILLKNLQLKSFYRLQTSHESLLLNEAVDKSVEHRCFFVTGRILSELSNSSSQVTKILFDTARLRPLADLGRSLLLWIASSSVLLFSVFSSRSTTGIFADMFVVEKLISHMTLLFGIGSRWVNIWDSWRSYKETLSTLSNESGSRPQDPGQKSSNVSIQSNDAVLYVSSVFLVKFEKFSMPSSCLICISGQQGAGKTSVCLAFLKELELLSGTLVVSRSISFAAQEPWIFEGSIAENIWISLAPNETEVNRVIRLSALEDDVFSFPGKINYELSDNGSNISGGQRQRVGLARCFVSSSEILILDDPFSALDKSSASICLHSIENFSSSRCVVMTSAVSSFAQFVGVVKKGALVISENVFLSTENDHENTLGNAVCKKTHENQESKTPPEVEVEFSVEKSYKNKKMLTVVGKSWIFYLFLGSLMSAFALVASFYSLRQLSESSSKTDIFVVIYLVSQFLNVFIVFGTQFTLLSLWERHTFVSLLDIIRVLVQQGNPIAIKSFKMRFNSALIPDVQGISVTCLQVANTASIIGKILAPFVAIFLIKPSLLGPLAFGVIASLLLAFSLQPTLDAFMYIYIRCFSDFIAHCSVIGKGRESIRVFKAVTKFAYKSIDRAEQYLSINVLMSSLFGLRDMLDGVIVGCTTLSFLIPILWSRVPSSSLVDVGLLLTFGRQLFSELTNLTIAITVFRRARELCGRIHYVVDISRKLRSSYNLEPVKVIESSTSDRKLASVYALRLVCVSAQYPNSKNLVLKNVTFEVKPGEQFCVSGASGSGKSSLFKVIMGFLEISRGSIHFFANDRQSTSEREWLHLIAYAPQTPTFFHGSIREELDPMNEHSNKALERALRVCALSPIMSNLSGRLSASIDMVKTASHLQLLSNARFILKSINAPVLLLDEPTSFLGEYEEKMFLSSLVTFKEKAILIISHRAETMNYFEKVAIVSKNTIFIKARR